MDHIYFDRMKVLTLLFYVDVMQFHDLQHCAIQQKQRHHRRHARKLVDLDLVLFSH